MSAADKAAETAKEVVADAAEGISEQAENFAEFARQLNKAKIQFAVGGWVLGAVTGAFFAYKFAYSQAETKYSKIVDEEIADMRRHYMEKGKALEAEAAKGESLENIVTERGYAKPENEKPPMAVQPPMPPSPNLVVEKEEDEEAEEDPSPDSEVRNIFEEAQVDHEWDYQEELKKRDPDKPYVIHYDERHELEYDITTLTYYEGDDVLCRENDEIVDPDYEREALVGEANLDRFGHGSNDASIVYVRNDKLELIFEIVKSPHHYAEEVHGFHHSGYGKNLERMRARERDDQEE